MRAKIAKKTHFANFFAALLLLASPCAAQQAQRPTELIRTVVVDAGHGGKDAGAVYAGGRYMEKDIVLAVALKFGKLINEHYPNVKVVYTRTTDVFVEVDDRGRIANQANADLFFSIHTNSNQGRPGTGTETYVMGLTKSSQNLATVMRENDVISMEADYSTKYMGYEPGDSESLIIFSLMQFAYREQSLQLARCVQSSYRKNFTLIDRGVKEGPFLVLWAPAMPSVLTELGFINNNNDLKELISDAGQDKYAQTLLAAFAEYKTLTESVGGPLTETGDRRPETGDRRPETDKPAAQQKPAPATTNPVSGIYFSVQVRASGRRIALDDSSFGAYRGEVFERHISPYYKYFVGKLPTYDAASDLQQKVARRLGNCFVVAFDGERPIPVSEAIKRSKR